MKLETHFVRAFHQKHGFPIDVELKPTGVSSEQDRVLQEAMMLAKSLITSPLIAHQRVSLILEEAVETCYALLGGDLLETADGLADLAYVTIGTAVAYNLPLEAVFDEVHASNMSKPKTGEPLLKGAASKSGGYFKADIAKVLRQHGRLP